MRLLRTCADPFLSQIKTGMGSAPPSGCKPERSDFKGLGNGHQLMGGIAGVMRSIGTNTEYFSFFGVE
jgi:hypothetical protein